MTIVSGEIFARYYLGLGTPPLSMPHPKIEYMFRPNQDVSRFGNRILINQYGMRAAPFADRATESELRIMVFGDSVLNGGNQTDHAALATTMLQGRLTHNTKGKGVVVGNISAGSWGAGNWLAYAKEYGFFGAKIMILVISSHDYADNPTFETLDENTHPTRGPISALSEGVTRYLPRYMPRFNTGATVGESDNFEEKVNEQEVQKGLNDLRDFMELALKSSATVLVLQHWEKSEIEQGFPGPGNLRIREVCESLGISPIPLEPYFRAAIQSGNDPYRDNIHLNQTGQKILAEALFENLPKTGFSIRAAEVGR